MAAIVAVCSRFRSFYTPHLVKFCQKRHYAKRKTSGKDKNNSKHDSDKDDVFKHKPWVVTKVNPAVSKQTRASISGAFKSPPVDNVWVISEHKPQLFNIEEVLNMHRESHHPTVYNDPNAKVYASFDLDMSMGPTKTKPMEPFRGNICYQNLFDKEQEKRILAIVNDKVQQEAALKAGAIEAGGFNVIDMFKNRDLSHTDFDHIIVHQDMVSELAPIRTMIKHHYPSKQRGNIAINVGELVYKFFHGVEYRSEKDMFEVRYALVDVLFGRLSMEDRAIEENLKSAIEHIEAQRPKNVPNPFILSVRIWSPPSPERLHFPFWNYLTDAHESELFVEKYTTVHFKEKSFIL